jgi:hypothetical protein
MSHVGTALSDCWNECTSLIFAEAFKYWNEYTHIPVKITRTTALYRALSWWKETANYYYARARWIVFVIVLVYWKTIAARRSKQAVAQQGVGHMGVRSNERHPRYHLKAFVTRTGNQPYASAVNIDKDA